MGGQASGWQVLAGWARAGCAGKDARRGWMDGGGMPESKSVPNGVEKRTS